MSPHEETLEIAVDGQHIAGTLLDPGRGGPTPAVLFVHGWGGSQEQYVARAREIVGLGCVCLTFDLRGHAKTQPQHETVSRGDNLRDLLAAYDLLARHRGVDPSAIGVVGSSYGAYLGAILTSLRGVRWLALRAPALYKDADWELPKRQLHLDPDFSAYRRRAVRPEDNRALCACEAFRGDVLLVESEHDHVVPHPVIANYLAACVQVRSLTYRVIQDADHGLAEEPSRQAYTSILVNWLTEMTAGARAEAPPPGRHTPGATPESSSPN
jgi:pimeloyl-ACP methyl ester carboxylesterase